MRGKTAIVPVTYSRIGFIDSNLHFERDVKNQTIEYELTLTTHGWKVSGPKFTGYPYQSAAIVIARLKKIEVGDKSRAYEAISGRRAVEEALK